MSDPAGLAAKLESLRTQTFVSCWTRGVDERDDMWRGRRDDRDRVLLNMRVDHLCAALQSAAEDVVVGGVRYFDSIGSFVEAFPRTNGYDLAFCKGSAFAWEKETRFVYQADSRPSGEALIVDFDLMMAPANVVLPRDSEAGDDIRRISKDRGIPWVVTTSTI